MIIDAHAHIFAPGVIANVIQKKEMTRVLDFQTASAHHRVNGETLQKELGSAGVGACLILPTASALGVKKMNDRFLEMAGQSDAIFTACTLHPDYPQIKAELVRMKKRGVRGIKLCSFSQGFSLETSKTMTLFDAIRDANTHDDGKFFVILDTFYRADEFFGTPPENNPTPARIGALVRNYPDITFIAAHMGGLTAPFTDIYHYLPPRENLYLDTSNAAHTLSADQFQRLLRRHGPGHVIFGTDWPWFEHASEIRLIRGRLDDTGFTRNEKDRVFGGNMASLLGSRAIAEKRLDNPR